MTGPDHMVRGLTDLPTPTSAGAGEANKGRVRVPEILVCQVGELADGAVRIVKNNNQDIGVIRHDGAWYAYRNFCPHQGGPACEGVRMPAAVELLSEGGVTRGLHYDESEMHIVCPWHGYEFRLSDGVHARDEHVRLKKYEVVERDGSVYVLV